MSTAMALLNLPSEVFSNIIHEFVLDSNLVEILKTRTVNGKFDKEILRILFDIGAIDDCFYSIHDRNRYDSNEVTAKRYWKGFLRRSQPESPNWLKWEWKYLHNAIDIMIPHYASQEIAGVLEDKSQIDLSQDSRKQFFEVALENLCQAVVYTLGPRDTWFHLCPKVEKHGLAWPDVRSHIKNKEGHFWLMLCGTYHKDRILLDKCLDHFRVSPEPEQIWLDRLSGTFREFSNNSTKKERDWLRCLAVGLNIAAKQGDDEMVSYLFDQNVVVTTPVFRAIKFQSATVLEAAIKQGHLSTFKLLMEKGWSVTAAAANRDNNNYANALAAACSLPTDNEARYEILTSLFDMSKEWQYVRIRDKILSAAAAKNDVRLGQIMLEKMSTESVESDAGYGSWPDNNLDAAFYQAAKEGYVEFLKFYCEHEMKLKNLELANTGDNRTYYVLRLVEDDPSGNHEVLTEILKASTDWVFTDAMKTAITEVETFAIFAKHVDLTAAYTRYGTECTVGQLMLSYALQKSCVDAAKLLINEYNIRLEGTVKGPQISLDDEDQWESFVELRKLLRANGMNIATKLKYDLTFHSGPSHDRKESYTHEYPLS